MILCNTSHPGNIGAAARAMKNMGVTDLALVSPHQFPDPQATFRASGADDLLTNATVVSSLEEAAGDCQFVFGTSARHRTFQWPQLSPKIAAQKILDCASRGQKVAIVFGNEQAGLSNDDLQMCDYHICIPTNPDFSSLNLGAAVQVISYEIYQAFLGEQQSFVPADIEQKATLSDVQGVLKHMVATSIDLNFLDPTNPKNLLPRLRKLLTKAQLTLEEVNIIRGFLKAVKYHTKIKT
jgi:tRNA (cytidine32/uridine32-2'-O)-methyltransferase